MPKLPCKATAVNLILYDTLPKLRVLVGIGLESGELTKYGQPIEDITPAPTIWCCYKTCATRAVSTGATPAPM